LYLTPQSPHADFRTDPHNLSKIMIHMMTTFGNPPAAVKDESPPSGSLPAPDHFAKLVCFAAAG